MFGIGYYTLFANVSNLSTPCSITRMIWKFDLIRPGHLNAIVTGMLSMGLHFFCNAWMVWKVTNMSRNEFLYTIPRRCWNMLGKSKQFLQQGRASPLRSLGHFFATHFGFWFFFPWDCWCSNGPEGADENNPSGRICLQNTSWFFSYLSIDSTRPWPHLIDPSAWHPTWLDSSPHSTRNYDLRILTWQRSYRDCGICISGHFLPARKKQPQDNDFFSRTFFSR